MGGGGRRVPPQEEAPVKGEGGLGRPALRAKATDLGGQWLDRGKSAGRGLSIWDQLWLLLWANNALVTKKPAWTCYLPPLRVQSEERNQKA